MKKLLTYLLVGYYYIIFDLRWDMKFHYRRLRTVATMLLKREKRLYYLYDTREVVEITAFNYLKRVKHDNGESAFIETITRSTGEFRWTRADRF